VEEMQRSAIEPPRLIYLFSFLDGIVFSALFCLQHEYPVEVDLDETQELTMNTSPDTVGSVKYTTFHDYDTVSRLPVPHNMAIVKLQCSSFIWEIQSANLGMSMRN
jgi:hypothetical protein